MLPHAEFLTILMFVSAFVAMLVSTALAFFNTVQRHASRLLGISLLSIAFFAVVSALLVNHAIAQVPHLFRTAAPLQYLMAPCAYLYVRAVLYRENRFRRYDWLHFLPFVVHTLELMPFLLHSAEYKLAYLQQLAAIPMGVVRQQEGWLPAYCHPLLKFALSSGYAWLQWRLIRHYVREVKSTDQKISRVSLNWLKTFAALNSLLYPPILLAMLLPISVDSVLLFAVFAWGVYLLLTSTLLFFRPCILFGMVDAVSGPVPETRAVMNADKESPIRASLLSMEKSREYRQKLEAHIRHNQPFLRRSYSLKELSAESNIAPHHLSAFINQEYRMNFNDFINLHRVEYVKEKLTRPDWRQLTLEGVALEAGFNNRTTFFRAFTKHTGTTPSEYISRCTSLS